MGFIRTVAVALGLLTLASASGLAQQWAVSTNLADYAALATLNLDVSAAVHRNFSVGASVNYNPFTWNQGEEKQFQLRHLDVDLAAKWWPWHVYSGWWLSAAARYRCYNFGGIVSPSTEEGDAVGMAASAGYSLMIGSHLNLDFGLGLWAGRTWYTRYACPRCGMTLEKGSRPFVLPDNLIISLTYVF